MIYVSRYLPSMVHIKSLLDKSVSIEKTRQLSNKGKLPVVFCESVHV